MVFRMLLTFALCLCGSTVMAQEAERDAEAISDVFDRGCGDDQGTDRCDPEVQQRMRGYYGLDTIESLAQGKVATYRTMLVDGYGVDVAAIIFARPPGQAPYVEVRAPSLTPEDEQPLRAVISPEVWQRVQGLSANFDQKLASETDLEDGLMRLCLHGWFAVVEAVTVRSPSISITYLEGDMDNERREITRPAATVRKDSEGACADGLAMPFAFALADEARRALAECSNLKLDDFRNSAMMLATCHWLRGDRLTAARAYEVVERLNRASRSSEEPDLSQLFVDYEGEDEARFTREVEGAFVTYSKLTATSPSDAVLETVLYYMEDDEAEMPSHQARMTIQLYDYADDFRIFSWEISDREPFVPPVDLR